MNKITTLTLNQSQIEELTQSGETISNGISIVNEFQINKPQRLDKLINSLDEIMAEYHPETYLNDAIWDVFNELITEIQEEKNGNT